MHFAVQQPTRAGVEATAASLLTLPALATGGMSADERSRVVNFALPAAAASSGDFYKFVANAGDALVITSANDDPLLDLSMGLYDSAGNLVASNEDGGTDGRNARIEYVVPAGQGGAYFVAVGAENG